MSLDATTEKIAHFIGLFDLKIEELRLRFDYDLFKALQAEDEDAEPVEIADLPRRVDHDLGGFAGVIKYVPPAPPPPAASDYRPPRVEPPEDPPPLIVETAVPPPALVTVPVWPGSASAPPLRLDHDRPAPIESLGGVTIQKAFLSDNDVIGSASFPGGMTLEDAVRALEAAATIAHAMSAVDVDAIGTDPAEMSETAIALARAFESLAPHLPEGATAVTLRGGEVAGVHVNGVAVSEMPAWDDHLPAHLRSEDDADAATTATAKGADPADDLGAGIARIKADAGLDGGAKPEGVEPGHEIVTGANVMVNEAFISIDWLDAPLYVVAGRVVDIDAISQVNLLIEHDRVLPSDPASKGASTDEPANRVDASAPETPLSRTEGTGQATEGTALSSTPSTAPQPAGNKGAAPETGGPAKSGAIPPRPETDGGTPAPPAYPSATASAPATSKQPAAEPAQTARPVERTGQPDEPATPSKTINAAMISATSTAKPEPPAEDAGSGPPVLPTDAIIDRIEGDLTLVNVIKQFSFITDMDRAEIQFSASATFIGMGENLATNAASLFEFGFDYDLIIVGEDMIQVTLIDQTNILLDADTVKAPNGKGKGVSTDDNLLMNQAAITTEGIDSYREMTKAFADAARDLAKGKKDLAKAAMRDEAFEGTDTLRVLYIAGNLNKINAIEQYNILGDQDEVHLAMAKFEQITGEEPVVTTGSNALLNAAEIREHGMDSTIEAGGEIYSQAFLHQAELIDTDAHPLKPETMALANEAIAFLADDMIPNAPQQEGGANATSDSGPLTADVMQTMLS